MGFQLAVADPGIVGRGMMYPVSYHPTPFCLFSASPSLSFAAAGPVTLELRSSRLSRAQKILPSMARAWPITVFFVPIPRQQYVVTAFLLCPTSIHHAPYITLNTTLGSRLNCAHCVFTAISRLVPKTVTLNDLERRNGRVFALFRRIR